MGWRRVVWAAGAVALIAAGCGADKTVSAGSAEPLSAEKWCAEYEQVATRSGITQMIDQGAGQPAMTEAQVREAFQEYRRLAEVAPSTIRDDLRAMWSMQEGSATPPSTPPDTIPEQFAEAASRVMRWMSTNCPQAPEESPESAEFPEPTGEWAVAQSGTVGQSRWTLYRTDATHEGVCTSFEADPPNTNFSARTGIEIPGMPPGMPQLPGVSPSPGAPPIPLPPVDAAENSLPGQYRGKASSCSPKPDLFKRSDPVIFSLHEEHETNTYNVLAGLVVPGATSLKVTFDSGHEASVTPVGDSFVLTYDPHERVKTVVPNLGDRANIICDEVKGVPVPGIRTLGCRGSVNR